MAFVMNYIDSAGNGGSGTYWRADEISIVARKKTGRIVYVGWKSQAHFLAGQEPGQGKEWMYVYLLTPQNFDIGLAAANMDLDTQLAACDPLALLVKDVGTPPGFDENDNPLPDERVSFFENATQV